MIGTGSARDQNVLGVSAADETLAALDAERLGAIGQMSDGVAHDFSNLMAAMHSGLGLLERRLPVTEEARQIIGMMRHAATQGTDLVNQLLAFCNGRPGPPTSVRLCDLEQGMRLLIPSLMKGSGSFEWRVEASAWPVHADAGRLELALVGLIGRARDLGEGVAVSARNESRDRSRPHLEAGDYLVIRVCNEIAGSSRIEADDAAAFPGSLDPAQSPPFYNIHSFARHMKGMLQVDIPADRGCTADLWLPRAV